MQKVLRSIFRNLEKLRKYPVIFGDIRRLSQVFGSVRASLNNFGSIRLIFRKSSEIFGRFLVVVGNFRTFSGDLRKVSHDLRRSSKYIGWPPAVVVLTSDIFVVICTRVTLSYTVLTKNALLFSQSEMSNFFKCIINSDKSQIKV